MRAASLSSLAASHAAATVLRAGKAAQTIIALTKADLVTPARFDRTIVQRVLSAGASDITVGGFAACIATRCRDQRDPATPGDLPEDTEPLADSEAIEVRLACAGASAASAPETPPPDAGRLG